MQNPDQREVMDAESVARLRRLLRVRGSASIPMPQLLAAAEELRLLLEELDDVSNAVVARIRYLEERE